MPSDSQRGCGKNLSSRRNRSTVHGRTFRTAATCCLVNSLPPWASHPPASQTAKSAVCRRVIWYSWVDSNHRPPDPRSAVPCHAYAIYGRARFEGSGRIPCSPSQRPIHTLFSRRAHQRDCVAMAHKLGQLRVIPKPQREHVAGASDDDRFPPAILKRLLRNHEMTGCDLVPGPG